MPDMPRAITAPSREVQEQAQRRAVAIADGLFAHQVEGVAFLLGRRRSILADDMGLGKTRQSIIAMTEAAPAGPYLVVCPASIKHNWQREILAVRPKSDIAIVGPGPVPVESSGWVIINYDILGKHIDTLLRHQWAGIVFDEAHYLKNHSSQRSRFARKLADQAGPDVLIQMLTGTPLTNRPRDLFALLQLARHPMAKSFLSFAKRYCAAFHNGYGWVTDGASNLDELRLQLHGLMLRRTKDDVLDLPPKVRTWLPVDIPEGTARRESRKVLELLIAHSSSKKSGGAIETRIELLSHITRGRRKLAIAKTRHTIDLVQSMLDQDEKVLIFSCFAEPVETIAKQFGAAALTLTGETPGHERQAIVDAFQNDDSVRMLVANIIAGGIGFNLTAARQVVFNDLDWVPANHWQAEDRAYRIGQTGTVNVTYLVGIGTIDSFVADILASKAGLVAAVVEGDGPLPGDVLSSLEAFISAMSPQLVDLPESELKEDSVDRLLREVSRGFEQKSMIAAQARTRSGLDADAIAKLADALAGSPSARYRVKSGRKADVFYTLEVDGPDVVCDCPGFEYRGNCTHSRTLKAALNENGEPPAGFEPVD
jgi:SWI/SNF-related matrix-associated actin-dependent regulator of chromatin subfamily A-like protein 1